MDAVDVTSTCCVHDELTTSRNVSCLQETITYPQALQVGHVLAKCFLLLCHLFFCQPKYAKLLQPTTAPYANDATLQQNGVRRKCWPRMESSACSAVA